MRAFSPFWRGILYRRNATRAWFGRMSLERLVTEWVRATDQTKRKQLADEGQKVALSEGTYVPWGGWVQPTACRKNVRDRLRFAGAWSSTLPSQILPWLVPLLRALMATALTNFGALGKQTS